MKGQLVVLPLIDKQIHSVPKAICTSELTIGITLRFNWLDSVSENIKY